MSNALLNVEMPPPKKILGFGEASSQPATSRQVTQSSQPVVGNQPALSSQPIEPLPASSASSQPATSRQVTQSSQPVVGNLIASLPDIKGDGRIPHRYSDYLCKLLSPDEQAVYFQLYRLSWGWNKDTCFVSNPRLSERSNVPLSTMKRAVTKLVSKGLVIKTGQTNGFGKDQGVGYRLPSVGWQPIESKEPAMSSQPTTGTNKQNVLNKVDKKVIPVTDEEKAAYREIHGKEWQG